MSFSTAVKSGFFPYFTGVNLNCLIKMSKMGDGSQWQHWAIEGDQFPANIFFHCIIHLVFINRVLNDKFDFDIHNFIRFIFSAKDLRNTAYPRMTATKKWRLFFTKQFFYCVCQYVNMLYSMILQIFLHLLKRLRSHSKLSACEG